MLPSISCSCLNVLWKCRNVSRQVGLTGGRNSACTSRALYECTGLMTNIPLSKVRGSPWKNSVSVHMRQCFWPLFEEILKMNTFKSLANMPHCLPPLPSLQKSRTMVVCLTVCKSWHVVSLLGDLGSMYDTRCIGPGACSCSVRKQFCSLLQKGLPITVALWALTHQMVVI